jgi:DNA-directed RNA polymerase subunit RPC12/RpoP
MTTPTSGGKIENGLARRAQGRLKRMLTKYRERLKNEHGWEVPLRCSRCGADAVPIFHGWTPSQVINFGNKPTIYANLECPKCGENMKELAGEKLVEMFAEERTSAKFKQMLVLFIAACVGMPALLLFLPRTWWMYAMIPYFVLLQPMIHFFNWQVHSPRFRCDCGEPAYKFMGMLGRSYCYRCSTCGRLLRLRD